MNLLQRDIINQKSKLLSKAFLRENIVIYNIIQYVLIESDFPLQIITCRYMFLQATLHCTYIVWPLLIAVPNPLPVENSPYGTGCGS